MKISNVPDKFYREIQRRYNFLGIEPYQEEQYVGRFAELYVYHVSERGDDGYADWTLQSELLSLKEGQYFINANSIDICEGLLRGLKIEDIVFIKEFNIKTIQDFVKIISASPDDLVDEYPHLAEFIDDLFYKDAYLNLEPANGPKEKLEDWDYDIIDSYND